MDSSMKRRFSGKALRAMMLPLFAEQLLVMLVGIVDTLAVSYLFLWRERTGKWREFQVI